MDLSKIEALERQMDGRVIKAALTKGLDPVKVDWHLEAVHGWESHDPGYIEIGLRGTIECMLKGGCGR